MIFNTAMYYTEEAAIKISVPIPTQKGKLYYTGNEQTPQWDNYDPKTSSISGDTSGTADGTYTAIFTLTNKDMYIWEDGTTDDKHIDWYIGEKMYEWISARLPTSLKWSSTAYGNGKFVCVANESNKYIYSLDNGNTWIESTLPGNTGEYNIITFGNDKFLAISSVSAGSYYNRTALCSQDGITWSSYELPNGYAPSNIVYGNGKFVFPNGTGVYYSENGIDWYFSNISSDSFTDIAYGNGLFIVTTGRKENAIAFSANGVDWSTANIGWANEGSAVDAKIAYGDGKFVIKTSSWGSVESYIAHSTNAINWTSFRDDVTFGYIDALIYADNKFLDIRHTDYTLGSTGTSYFSDDGITAWAEVSFPDGISPNCATYGENKYVALDSDNYLFAYMETSNIDVPTQKGTLTYTGSVQSPTWSGYESGKMTMSGDTEATDAGGYVATFTPKSNYHWTDGTETARNVDWKIDKAIISSVPYSSGNLTYNGSAQSPTWGNYDPSKMTMSGDTSGTNKGRYTTTFTPKSNYTWADGTSTGKDVTWFIFGVDPQLEILPYKNFTLTDSNPTATLTISTISDGTRYIYDNYCKEYVDCTLVDDTVTVKAKKSVDECLLNIGVRETDYYRGTTITCQITVNISGSGGGDTPDVPSDVSKTLSENSWDTISKVSASGQGANYWSVGDTKPVPLNGYVGAVEFTNVTIDAFIVGFDHNQNVESPGEHRIHFEIGKFDNTLVSLATSQYGNSMQNSNNKDFSHVNKVYDAKIWSESVIRNYILGADSTYEFSLKNALPSELTAVMKTVSKHSPYEFGYIGQSEKDDITNDILALASATEYNGEDSTEPPRYLSTSQTQYQYYKAGNNFYRNRYNNSTGNVGEISEVWTRTPVSGNVSGGDFICIYDDTSNTLLENAGYNSLSISPIFFV